MYGIQRFSRLRTTRVNIRLVRKTRVDRSATMAINFVFPLLSESILTGQGVSAGSLLSSNIYQAILEGTGASAASLFSSSVYQAILDSAGSSAASLLSLRIYQAVLNAISTSIVDIEGFAHIRLIIALPTIISYLETQITPLSNPAINFSIDAELTKDLPTLTQSVSILPGIIYDN